jgi:hypothetical protein
LSDLTPNTFAEQACHFIGYTNAQCQTSTAT